MKYGEKTSHNMYEHGSVPNPLVHHGKPTSCGRLCIASNIPVKGPVLKPLHQYPPSISQYNQYDGDQNWYAKLTVIAEIWPANLRSRGFESMTHTQTADHKSHPMCPEKSAVLFVYTLRYHNIINLDTIFIWFIYHRLSRYMPTIFPLYHYTSWLNPHMLNNINISHLNS